MKNPPPHPDRTITPFIPCGQILPDGAWREEFFVRTGEADCRERARPSTLGRFLQEAAIHHARFLRAAFDDLAPHGITWVLVQLRLNITHWPLMDEFVEVVTWPSGCDALFAYRDFLLHDRSGREIMRGISSWALLDRTTHRPVRVPEFIRAIPRPDRPRVLADGFPRLRTPQQPTRRVRVRVLRSDLDLNWHVTNTRYLDWVIEGTPDDLWEEGVIRELHVQYRAETRAGDELITAAEILAPPPEAPPAESRIELRHALQRVGDDRLLVLARSFWRYPKES